MNSEELQQEIHYLFYPEPDEQGAMPIEFPHPKLQKRSKLDFSYMENYNWEGSSTHQYSRLCQDDDNKIRTLTRNSDVSERLFEAGLFLLADSIIAYHDVKKRQGFIRYYPSIILTFWSGFETFIRYSSELLIATAKNLPVEVTNFLLEKEPFINRKGEIEFRTKYQPILDRYAVFLKYGYSLQIERGNKYWQNLEKAQDLRDYYTHLDINEPRSISTTAVLNFIETILLSIIWPSTRAKRTIFFGVYRLYAIWAELGKLAKEYVEQPFFKDWDLSGAYMFYCNFDNVNIDRFPNSKENLERHQNRKREG